MKDIEIEKPEDWPQNNREANLDVIYRMITRFVDNPSYINKEILFSTLDPIDLNEINELGPTRICEYEIALINELYQIGKAINCVSLIAYLYGHIARYTQFHKMLYYMQITDSIEIEEYNFLNTSLKLFYFCYRDFSINKNRTLTDSIIDISKKGFYGTDDASKEIICHAYNVMLYDLGFANSNKIFTYLRFDRNELKKLFELSASFNNYLKKNITQHPLRGILKLSLRQWILKSRYNYQIDTLFKCISNDNIQKAYSNHEVWMKNTKKLNDKREQKVIKELFSNKTWLTNDWARKIQIEQLNNCYVCSFTKTTPTDALQKRYGHNISGYKTDRIANLLSPIRNQKGFPFFEQVAYYDIIYDTNEAKEEINYLCDLINLFDLSKEEKASLLKDILKYWNFSFKDKKWADEAERRYQIFIFDNDYYDQTSDQDFLKIKSSLYLYPDFLLSNNNKIKKQCRERRLEKLSWTATKDYWFCDNCLQADFSAALLSSSGDSHKCAICGSSKTQFRKPVL